MAANTTKTKKRKAPAKQPASRKTAAAKKKKQSTRGYHTGGVDTVISVEDVTRQVEAIAEEVSIDQLDKLVQGEPYLTIDHLNAGYGKMEILHDLNLRVSREQ